jgi:diacylglycerol kinase (ATP)
MFDATPEIATLPDGRTLEYLVEGDPDGLPLVLHHGTPGSAVPFPKGSAAAAERGLALVMYTRAGYGGSTPNPGRAVADVAADIVVGSRVREVDLARAGATYFVTVLAAGFDSKVNERANAMTWPKGQMRYNLATIAELRVFQPLPYTLVLDGEEHRLDAMLVAVGNGSSFGGGLRITEGARLDDGLLDVVVIRPMSKRRLVASYPRLFTGTITEIPEYEHHLVKEVPVAAPGIVAYADGERIGSLPLTVEVAPAALRVLVP